MLTIKKKIFKIVSLFLLLFILIVNNSYAALVKQSEEFFVNDTSNVLSSETKDYIIRMNKGLESQTGAQIVVVTVESLDGLSVEDYSLQLARSYRNW